MRDLATLVNIALLVASYSGIRQVLAVCKDLLPDCHHYGRESCGGPFEQWARRNCANYCHYCNGPTTPAPLCMDVADDCDTIDKSACADPKFATWATESCRYYCRLCPNPVLREADKLTTTLPPKLCVDMIDCAPYGKSTCGGEYLHWAKTNCPAYCGFCKPVPTIPPPCHDTVPHCDMYVTDICQEDIFRDWTLEHCRKYCNLCT